MLYREHYGLPEYDLREILRYAGADKDVPELRQVLKDCIDECRDVFSGKVCYTKVPVCVSESSVDLSFASVQSRALAKKPAKGEMPAVFGVSEQSAATISQ